jgi:hypothetical protein
LLKGLVATVLVVVGAGLLVFLLQLVVPTERSDEAVPARAAAPPEPEPAEEYRAPNRVQERLKAIEDARARADEPPAPADP